MPKIRLSKAQFDLLTSAIAAGRATCAQGYQPVAKLVSLGLVTSHEGKMGGHWVEPTETGRLEHLRHMEDAR